MKDTSPSTPPCDHLRVNIVRIIRAFSPRTKSRIIGAHCQDCSGDVQREMTASEIKGRAPQTVWR